MAKAELGPDALLVAQAVARVLPQHCVVGVSGGPDSWALALGAQWAAAKSGAIVRCLVVDHQLQPGSAEVAARVVTHLRQRGMSADVRTVEVQPAGDGLEAAARKARLEALQEPGWPVLLGHTMDDQAEQVVLGLVRGSGIRSLAGIAPQRGPFIRPLLEIRRDVTLRACQQWGVEPWLDPHNTDPAFRRVQARLALAELSHRMGVDFTPALARTAHLARMDADYLDSLAHPHVPGEQWQVTQAARLPDVVRWRVWLHWLRQHGCAVEYVHVQAADQLITAWRGQRGVDVPGGCVRRRGGSLYVERDQPLG